MFTQAHIQLSLYLADKMKIDEIERHKISLSIGSILPDRSPRQRMKNHEFTETWEDTKERIRKIETMRVTDEKSGRAMCRQIGIVLHYLADYFTCPHNPSYGLNIIQHSFYEGWEALCLRTYLDSPKAKRQFLYQKKYAAQIHSTEELFSHIEKMHALYLLEEKHTPQGDCRWILGVCACAAILLTSEMAGEKKPAA